MPACIEEGSVVGAVFVLEDVFEFGVIRSGKDSGSGLLSASGGGDWRTIAGFERGEDINGGGGERDATGDFGDSGRISRPNSSFPGSVSLLTDNSCCCRIGGEAPRGLR